eukprot:1152459-Pelagomonas_calceolata.AAC.6
MWSKVSCLVTLLSIDPAVCIECTENAMLCVSQTYRSRCYVEWNSICRSLKAARKQQLELFMEVLHAASYVCMQKCACVCVRALLDTCNRTPVPFTAAHPQRKYLFARKGLAPLIKSSSDIRSCFSWIASCRAVPRVSGKRFMKLTSAPFCSNCEHRAEHRMLVVKACRPARPLPAPAVLPHASSQTS